TARVGSFGGTCEIRIRPSLLTGEHPQVASGPAHREGRMRLVLDVLLHESIHQYAYEVSGQTEDSFHGHGPRFAEHCNRIGESLGLPPVRQAKRRGADKDLPSCAQWPHNVRPREWYRGAWVP